MAVYFLDDGTGSTQDFTFFGATSGTVASDASRSFTGNRAIKITPNPGVSGSSVTAAIGSVGANGRTSFYFNFDNLPTGLNSFFAILTSGSGVVCSLALNTNGTLNMTAGGSPSGTTVLSVNTWYRISVAWTITDSTHYSFNIWINGVFELTNTNTGTLLNTATNRIIYQFAKNVSAGTNCWFDNEYIDDSNTLKDPLSPIMVGVRPFANGTTNGFTGSGTPSGYGTGNAQYVNERPLNTTNKVSVVGAGSAVTEEYNVEPIPRGDVGIPPNLIIDYIGWVYCSSLAGETINIILNGVNFSQAITSTNTLYTKAAGSTTYPAGTGADIGIQTDTSLTTVSLFECGIIVAYQSIPTPYPHYYLKQGFQ